ncbi:MAG: hypothetical protein ICV60_01480 [Pyrinomonadaceae bacterium]|nr:hypothetical protein [Pyrinomonadaceae bacterium]
MSTDEAKATAAKRTRSPNYPAISLAEAIPRIAQIYEQEFTHAADSETLARALGYSGTNGASDAVISALKKYGLLENAGNREYKLSEGAIDICLHQKGDAERVKAIREAAFTPPLFKELFEEYGDVLPSENNLRVKLIKRGFNPKSVGDVIHAYRDTLDLVSQEAPEYNAAVAGKKEGEGKDTTPAGATSMQQPPSTGQSGTGQQASGQIFGHKTLFPQGAEGQPVDSRKTTELAFKLSRGSEARVTIYGDATQEAIAKLTALLELSQDTFPTQAELTQPRAAIWRNKDHDQPVKVIGEAGEHEGRRYMKIAESDTAVPEDELEYEAKGAA